MYELNENRSRMSDTERILEIIKVKDLNNIQFCSATGISPASLSHITSNRSKPTLSILRNVIAGFPDINPEWVMMGTGPMFREGADPSRLEADKASSDSVRPKSDSDRMNTLFPMDESVPSKPERRGGRKDVDNDSAMLPSSSIEAIVAATVMKMRQQRKVVEVRVFYDDDTFETFRKD